MLTFWTYMALIYLNMNLGPFLCQNIFNIELKQLATKENTMTMKPNEIYSSYIL